MDKLTPQARSLNMSKIRAKNTKPELMVRRILWNMGYRYRLHKASLPGKPDIYIPSIKTAVFIHGCFWHQHEGCKRSFMPKSNLDYWKNKLKNNVLRFDKVKEELTAAGFKVVVVWECETKNKEQLIDLIKKYLND